MKFRVPTGNDYWVLTMVKRKISILVQQKRHTERRLWQDGIFCKYLKHNPTLMNWTSAQVRKFVSLAFVASKRSRKLMEILYLMDFDVGQWTAKKMNILIEFLRKRPHKFRKQPLSSLVKSCDLTCPCPSFVVRFRSCSSSSCIKHLPFFQQSYMIPHDPFFDKI